MMSNSNVDKLLTVSKATSVKQLNIVVFLEMTINRTARVDER